MKDKLSELSSAQIAFRVAMFAGALALLSLFPPGLDDLIGGVLLIGAAARFYEAWIRRWSRRRLNSNLIWGVLFLGGGIVLLSGWMAMASTPLIALAAVCAALGVVALLSESRA